MYETHVTLGRPTHARHVALRRLQLPATYTRVGSPAAGLTAVPTGTNARPAPTAMQRLARAAARVLLAL